MVFWLELHITYFNQQMVLKGVAIRRITQRHQLLSFILKGVPEEYFVRVLCFLFFVVLVFLYIAFMFLQANICKKQIITFNLKSCWKTHHLLYFFFYSTKYILILF